MDKRLYTVSEEEKYYFDLRGYLVVRNALTAQEVSECNAAIDHFSDQISAPTPAPSPATQAPCKALPAVSNSPVCSVGRPPYREPFRRLLVHPTVVSRLNEFSGPGFRLDHGPLLISATEGTEGHYLHGAGEPFSPATWYHQQNGKIYCRGITVAWQLTDCNPGDGGFAVIPGSHKTCEPTPPEIRSLAEYGELVVQPALCAGDVLFFAETATPRHPCPGKAKIHGAPCSTNTLPEARPELRANTSRHRRATALGSTNSRPNNKPSSTGRASTTKICPC